MSDLNCYEDRERATAYAQLAFTGTYYLAYRDLPAIIARYTNGKLAIDFGCGTGRSTRFLRRLGFSPIGVDIAQNMVNQARKLDPEGDYRLISEADLSQFSAKQVDLVLAAFTFDNIPPKNKDANLRAISRVLKNEGILILLVSSPEMYENDWLSFSTSAFPENLQAKSGDKVRNLITDIEDRRAVEDYLCLDEDYRQIFVQAHLQLIETYRPLGFPDEPFTWVNEMKIAPWVIYVLGKEFVSKKSADIFP